MTQFIRMADIARSDEDLSGRHLPADKLGSLTIVGETQKKCRERGV